MSLLDAGLVIGCIFAYSCWSLWPGHWMHFFLHHVGRCDLVFLLDTSLVIGCIFASSHCFFLITLVVVASCSCWMPAWSSDACFLNHTGRCGLVCLLDVGLVIGCISFSIKLVVVALFLLDASLVIGDFFSYSHWLVWPCVLLGCRPGCLMHLFLNHIGRCGLVFLLDANLVIGFIFSESHWSS